MENVTQEKKQKPVAKASPFCSVRVKKETRKRLLSEIAKANKKDFGRRVHADEIVAVALSLLSHDHIKKIQEDSLSTMDRLERDYRAYVAKHGPITKDVYLGKRLNGEIVLEASAAAGSSNE